MRASPAWILIALPLLWAAPSAPAQQPEAVQGQPAAESSPAAERETAEPAAPPAEGRTLAEWYAMGGWVMHVLVGMSVLSLIVILERFWSLRRGATLPRDFLGQYRDHAHRGELKQVVELCSQSDHAAARVLRSGLVHFDQGLADMVDAASVAGEQESGGLRRNLPLLAALGNMATMLGLLGTVLGMIESFDLIAKTGTGDARVVAGGIFQALVTTAAGLMVGLVAIGAHSLLRRKAEGLEVELVEKSSRMLEDLWLRREASKLPQGEASEAAAG
ncbi:MAG: MotA/TolQ/ExbB proton channel family protein [Proteobacteria bacterium]|nr:MotA/TolQ/ExbB proton channel family protein [Pseudomonadota bacterium]